MLFRSLTVISALTVFGLLAAAPAEAQSRRGSDSTVTRFTDENGRTRTRVIVQKRSYLDAGTETMPGDRKYLDYVRTPNDSPTSVIDNTAFSRRSPLGGPFDLPGKNNPFQ